MNDKNFMSYGDAETVLTEFAQKIKNKEPVIFKGTVEEWDALTAEEQAFYSVKMITDDETGATVDAVIDGDMRAVTSNAVYDAINNIINYSTSERKVGTWIDGKPIYRMVDISAGQGEISAGGWATCGIGIPQYVDNIIDAYLLDIGSSTYVFHNLMFRMNGTNLQFLSAGQGISAVKSGSTRLYVAEYTKTTD